MGILDGDGQAVDKHGARRASTSRDVHDDTNVDAALGEAAAQASAALYGCVKWFVDHQTGSLKITRSQTGADLHFIWTWTAGELRGKYVYYCTAYWQVAYGLEVLRGKVRDVEAGRRSATPDKMVTNSLE